MNEHSWYSYVPAKCSENLTALLAVILTMAKKIANDRGQKLANFKFKRKISIEVCRSKFKELCRRCKTCHRVRALNETYVSTK